MLKKLCLDQPKEWDRLLPAILFAYREAPQESLKFSPFELLYGRHVRGPLQVLKQIWTDEQLETDVRTTAEYIIDLKERIEDACKIAQQNLEKASTRHAKYFDKKAKKRNRVRGWIKSAHTSSTEAQQTPTHFERTLHCGEKDQSCRLQD